MECKLQLTRDLKLPINTLNRFDFFTHLHFDFYVKKSTKEVIRNCRSRNRQYNGIKEKGQKR
jgi:hypothetical protein